MKKLTPKQLKRLDRITKLSTDSPVAITEHLFDLEDRFDEELPTLKQAMANMKGEKGEQGEMGLQGEQGEKGKDGIDGKDGKDGKDGLPGRDGIDGKDGRDGIDGKDGKDGKDGRDGKDGIDGKDAPVADLDEIRKDIEDVRGMAAANSVPVTTSFFNGFRAKNLTIDGATVSQIGDTVHVTAIPIGDVNAAGVNGDVQVNNNGKLGAIDGFLKGFTTATMTPQGINSPIRSYVTQTANSNASTTHATVNINNELWGATIDGKIYYITNPDSASPTVNTIFNNSSFAFYQLCLIGCVGGVMGTGNGNSGNYTNTSGKMYLVSGGSTTALFVVDIANHTATRMTISGSPGAFTQPSMDTDGTSLFVVSFASPAVFYKFSISGTTATLVSNQTWTGVNQGHMIRYNAADGFLYATSITGHLAKVNPSDLSFTDYNLGGTFTDDSAILNGKLYLGDEGGLMQVVTLSTMTAITVTDSHASFGIYTDGTNIFNMSTSQAIDIYPNGTVDASANCCYSFRELPLSGVPNELWITNGGQYVVPHNLSAVIDWVQLGSITQVGIGGAPQGANNLDVFGNARISSNLQLSELTAQAGNNGFISVDQNGNVVLNGTIVYNPSSNTVQIESGVFVSPGISDSISSQSGVGDLQLGDFNGNYSSTYLDINAATGHFTFNNGVIVADGATLFTNGSGDLTLNSIIISGTTILDNVGQLFSRSGVMYTDLFGGLYTPRQLYDGTTSAGTSGNILTSTGTTTNWKSPVAAGITQVITTVSATAQTADITSTNFSGANVAGLYRVSYSLEDTTSAVGAGAVTLTIAYTDNAGSATQASAAQVLTGTGRTQGSIFVQLASGSISYSTSHTGIFSTAKYDLFIVVERMA